MTPVNVTRHRHVSEATPFGEVSQKRRREKRHVTPDYQHLLRRRFDERRVKASERTRSADAIDDHGNIYDLHARPVVCDDQEMWSEPVQQRQLPIEDGACTNDERALVDAAQPPRPAASQDCRSPHVSARRPAPKPRAYQK